MSKVEVNTVEPQCGTTLTLGGSGDTVALGSGASQTGFGRTGTVDWDTSIKTSTVTAVTGKGYFVNTTAGAVTVNLPAAAVGSIVAVSDYASTSASNNITISPNGSEKINGVNAVYTIQTAGLAVTLVYADATRGWKSVTGSDADSTGLTPLFVTATGGTPCAGATCGDYKVHTFTGPGTLCVSCGGNSGGSNTVDYLVVAGGGGGARQHSGGGGAGGYLTTFTPSPAGLPVTVTGYPIGVGGGGPGSAVNQPGVSGTPSTFDTITSAGGGGGGGWSPGANAGVPGGSGGGGSASTPSGIAGGAGNTPATPVSQGNPGGIGYAHCTSGGGGGGGGSVAGADALAVAHSAGAGGAGTQNNIDGNNHYWAGGGGGGNHFSPSGPVTGLHAGPGGIGGGGGGGTTNPASPAPGGGSAINDGAAGGVTSPAGIGGDGGDNSGGGGGSAGASCLTAGAGGSGIVIIRYKFQ